MAFAKENVFFEAMLSSVIYAGLTLPGDIQTQLCNLSEREGRTIGRALAASLATSLTSDSAVDEWIVRFPALKQLDRQERWFRPMISTIARRVLGEVSWGLRFRVCFGAGLSIVDMLSDIFIIVKYNNNKDQLGVFALALICMVSLSLLFQLMIVWLQNRRRWGQMALEMGLVLVGCKPGLDAYKVATAKEQEAHNIFDAKFELILTKFVEMFAESIPGCLLQCYVFVGEVEDNETGGANWLSKDATQYLGSIAISAATAGYTSASITYDNDVDPANRRVSEFYGLIPDEARSRAILFVCMGINSFALLIIRCFTMALLFSTNIWLVVGWVAGDNFVYIVMKAVR